VNKTLMRASVILAVSAAPAMAQTLAIGVGNPVNSADPQFTNTTSNIAMGNHVFDRLVHTDAALRREPGLAESYRPISDTVWEFKLRPGVTWHDGRPFTAEDVAFSIRRVPNVPGSTGGFTFAVRRITQVEVVDALTIRFHTNGPHPLLPTDLSQVAILARHVGEGVAAEDFNSGRAAIGTGPFRFVSYHPGSGAVFVRNDAYWGPAPAWARVDYKFLANDPARTAALLSGDVQIIDQVPTSDLPRLRRDARFRISEVDGVRVIFLQPDFSRTGEVPRVTDNQGRPLPRNPFLDLRVRRALNHAIDRQALAERVMEGTAVATGQWLPAGFYSYNPDVGVPAYDPALSRRLLAEAGFPDGFRLVLTSPSDRYPNDAKVAQAVAQFWTRVGVRTEVEALPWAVYSPRGATQAYAVRLHGWGSGTGEASYLLRNIIGTYDRAAGTGTANHMRYSNPALDGLTERAITTLDDGSREQILRQAVAMASEDLGFMPLFLLRNAWASRADLRHEPRADEQTLAQGVTPAH
jgi:peptide/nickel transport system substrate-binding protein